MILDKKELFKKIVSKPPIGYGITPVMDNFKKKLLEELKTSAGKELELASVSPETIAKIENNAKTLTSRWQILWKGSKVARQLNKALPFINGSIDIPILKDSPEGEITSPTKVKPSTSKSVKKKLLFSDKKPRTQRREVAEIAKNRDPTALYKAASSKIGKIDQNKAFVMRMMDRKPEMASKFKKYYELHRKKKGRYLHILYYSSSTVL